MQSRIRGILDFRGLERCRRCGLPVTWETVYLDEEGICNICRNWEAKQEKINWEERKKELLRIVEDVKAKNASYDCIVPFSGGKDSTFTLYYAVKELGLRVLVVSFDHGFYRPKTLQNRTRTFRRLGVDVITFTPNWHIVRKLMLEALIRKGDFCWHCHAGVFAYPMQIALKFQVPLILWGEGGGEYEGYFRFEDIEETDEWKFNRRIILGMRAEDMAGFINADIRDLQPYLFPPEEELKKAGILSLPLGKFIEWSQSRNVEIIKKELGWEEDEIESLPGLTFDKIECMFIGIRDYIKFLKRGFSRMTHRVAIDIREGKITLEEGLKLIEQYEAFKPASLEIFLEYLGISEEEFNKIVLNHIIYPFKGVDPKTLPVSKKLWDQDLWFRDAKAENITN
ncbi:MAG: N-acetyl sugar amidotransferase [Aquificaceae bacterium]